MESPAPNPKSPQSNLVAETLFNTYSPDEMDFCVYLLTVVYGWKYDKIKKFKLATLAMWVLRAKKRMTAQNLMSLHLYLASKARKRSFWDKFIVRK